MKNREEMLESLRNNVCNVVFTKANGEKRVMKATLLKEWVENNMPLGASKSTVENTDVIRVIDTEKDAWRSFRVDSVIEFDDTI